MLYIYRYLNTENGKSYIGQTNNIIKRRRGHKSEANNPNSNGYKSPFHSAIRKYGLEKFKFEVLEEIPDEEGLEYLDQREKDFIQEYNSLTSQNGYNVTGGGQNGVMYPKKTFEELLNSSKIFSKEELLDIMELLKQRTQKKEIYVKYPKLTQTFLSNINMGYNFKNPDWTYPLAAKGSGAGKFSEVEIKQIRQQIADGKMTYREIAEAWGVKSQGFISQINTGKVYFDERLHYPIRESKYGKNSKYLEVVHYLISLPHESKASLYIEVRLKTGYGEGAIKRINYGHTRHDERLTYPLSDNQVTNKAIFKEVICPNQ